MARALVGTSGWSYPNWKGLFYPPRLKQGDWLSFYGGRFATVEINNSFYRLPLEATLRRWAECTPEDFVFAVKAWRAITHNHRLIDCREPLSRFLAAIRPLGAKCGPVIFQLPPGLPADPARLRAFLDLLPGGRRFAMEFRHTSWHSEETYALLRERNVAFCPFELAGLCAPRVVTADFAYVRLHGRRARYRGPYDEPSLVDWAGWLRQQMGEGRDVYMYFDNTMKADDAPRDARRLAAMLQTGDWSGHHFASC